MWSCDQSLVTLTLLWEKLAQLQSYKDLTKKATFFEGWSWFCFNSLKLALVMTLKCYTNDTKRLKLKVRMFLGLTPTFVEVWKLQEKNCLGDYLPTSPSWIGLLGRIFLSYYFSFCMIYFTRFPARIFFTKTLFKTRASYFSVTKWAI